MLLEPMVDAVPPVKGPRGRPGRPRKRPAKLHGDKGYDYPRCRWALRRRGIKPRIARRGIESSQRLGRHRYVVERSLAWLAGYRRAAVLHITRAAIVAAGADARRQLKALIITAPEPLRDRLRGRPWRQQVHACAELVAAPGDPVEHRATVQALALTAQRVLAARQDAHRLEAELRQLVTVMAPALLTKPGIGPITAAQLLISWSHPGRFRRSPPGSRACRPSGRSCRRSRAAVGSRSPFIWRPRWPGRIWVPNSLREMANCDRKHVGVTDRVLPAVGVSGLWSKCPPKSPEQRPICVT
jgi:hypothetical protein